MPSTMSAPASPLLDPGTSPLDVRQRAVVQRVSDAERAHILALPSNDPLDPKLRFRVEATGPELFGQPAAIQATLQLNAQTLDVIADRLAAGVRRVVLVGCGDSLAVMIAARQALECMLGVPCEPMQSLEFAYYHAHLVDADTAVIALSSSGETTRTVEALLVAQHRGSYTVCPDQHGRLDPAVRGRHVAEDRGDPGRLAHPVVHRGAGVAAGIGHPGGRAARSDRGRAAARGLR